MRNIKLMLMGCALVAMCATWAQDHSYTAPATVSDALTLQDGDRILLDGEGAVMFTGGMSVENGARVPILTAGTGVSYAFENALSGSGTLDFVGYSDGGGAVGEDIAVAYEGRIKDSPAMVVAQGFSVAELAGIEGTEFWQNDILLEERSGTGEDYRSKVFFFENDGQVATCQVQINQGGYNKCIFLRFTNRDGGLVCTVPEAWAAENKNGQAPIDGTFDFRVEEHLPTPYATTYNLRKMTVRFRRTSAAALSCTENAMTDSVFNITNGLRLSVSNVTSLPATGEVHVWSNSVLALAAGAASGQNGGNVAFYAHPGAIITASGRHSIGRDIEKGLTLDGAELVFTDDPGYCNILTLKNGSRVRTTDPAQGIWCVYGWSKAIWTVDGTSPSHIDSKLRVAIPSWCGLRFKLDVKDVTGSAAPDLFLGGPIEDYDTITHHFGVVEKRGAGTARHDAVNTVEHGVAILAGEWLLGTNLAMNATQPLELAGGTLGVAANCSNGVGIVTLKADSGIRLEEGAVLTFADQSSATDWTAGKTITITGAFRPGAIRFGTSAEALTPAQRRAFRFEGHSLGIDANGYLVEPPGLLLIVR